MSDDHENERPDERLPLLDKFYQQFLIDENTAVFIHSVSRSYGLGTLERLLRFGDRLSRRAACLAIGFLGDIRFNDTLGAALQDDDRAVRMLADHGIRQLWGRDGTIHEQAMLRRIMQLNDRHRVAEAKQMATELIHHNPGIAESWNQRAVAHYGLHQYSEAIEDCHEAVYLNRFHFASILGVANCYLQLDEAGFALEFFRSALEINPDLDSVRGQIIQLERALEG